MSGGSEIGKFQIRNIDAIRYPIRKNNLISRTYIANYKGISKIIVNLPWQYRLSTNIDIYIDDNIESENFKKRIIHETKPSYIFINGTKVTNNGVINLSWSELLAR